MKVEIAVLSGKEPFGVRLELSVKEAEIIAQALDEWVETHKYAAKLVPVIDNVKNLNQQQHQVTQPKGKAKPNG